MHKIDEVRPCGFRVMRAGGDKQTDKHRQTDVLVQYFALVHCLTVGSSLH